jgi:hypothetical protein
MRYLLTILFCLAATVASAQSTVSFAWDTPAEGPVLGYRVDVGTAPGTTVISTSIGPYNTAVVSFPTAGRYYVRVMAYNELGFGGPSNEVPVDIAPPPPPPPSDVCVTSPLTVTVNIWPRDKKVKMVAGRDYTSNFPVSYTYSATKGNTVVGITFRETSRNCPTKTVTR